MTSQDWPRTPGELSRNVLYQASNPRTKESQTSPRPDPMQLLKSACAARGEDFWAVMADMPDHDTDPEDDTQSQTSPHRRKNSLNSQSPFTSSASSNSSLIIAIWIYPCGVLSEITSLKATRFPQSNCLIRADVVIRHLRLVPKYLPFPCYARYKHMTLHCESTITLEWAWSANDLSLGRAQQNIFYLVDKLPGSDAYVVLGNSEVPDGGTSHACCNTGFVF